MHVWYEVELFPKTSDRSTLIILQHKTNIIVYKAGCYHMNEINNVMVTER